MQPTVKRTSVAVSGIGYDKILKAQLELSFKLNKKVSLQDVIDAMINVAVDHSSELQKELSR